MPGNGVSCAARSTGGGPGQECSPFSGRELARLSFVRWLYQRGHLDPLDPALNDNA
ncbi:MAG TPA: hypothetical protein VGP82_20115 [Ktedonobacterales bacterium]|nr:hypothetical protein [Ktedonobacterales bacterium]